MYQLKIYKYLPCICPFWRPGNANNELSLFGHSTQSPFGFGFVSKTWSCCGFWVNVNTLITPSNIATILSLRNLTPLTGALNSNVIAGCFFISSHITTVE